MPRFADPPEGASTKNTSPKQVAKSNQAPVTRNGTGYMPNPLADPTNGRANGLENLDRRSAEDLGNGRPTLSKRKKEKKQHRMGTCEFILDSLCGL